MSSSTSAKAAPWRQLFVKHLSEMESPEFVLSTLHPRPAEIATPRGRTVVFRGMWAGLPENSKNKAELNPDVYETDLVTFTTDARMDKVQELFNTATPTSGTLGSGGGGYVEAVIWAKEAKVQWRLRGRAYIIGPDIESDSPTPNALRETLLTHMRPKSSKVQKWSWNRELTAHFGNLSPMMRGTFRNPPPGTTKADNPADDTYHLGQKVEDLDDAVARANFRAVVIVPEEMDHVDLSDSADPRRWNYRFVGKQQEGGKAAEEGKWEQVELWP